MSTVIRVYPQGTNAAQTQGVINAQTYYNDKLKSQQQVSELQLGYERALADERIEKVKLEERLKNPYLSQNTHGAYGGDATMAAYAMYMMQAQAMQAQALQAQTAAAAATPAAGQTMSPQASSPILSTGGGQYNVTNQVSPNGGSQSVTNTNTHDSATRIQYPWPSTPHGNYGSYGSYGGSSGFLSAMLGAFV